MLRMKSIGILAAVTLLATQTAALAVTGGRDPIQVNRCDPRSGFARSAYPAGYVRSFYPGYPFYFVDPYGFRYYQPPLLAPGRTAPTLGIDYVNTSAQTAKMVDFGLVARGDLVAEVRDVGTFTTGAEIKHEFGLSPNVFPISTGLPRCIPLLVEFTDGRVWENPHRPHAARALYRQQARQNSPLRP